MSFLQGKIPASTQGVYFANFGTDFISFIQGLHTLNPNVTKIGANFVLSGEELPKLEPAVEGTYVVTGYPETCPTNDPSYDLKFRHLAGMDCAGHEIGTGKELVPSYSVSTWETLFAIKEIIDKSGWKSKADTAKFIKTIEGYQFQPGLAHPSGAKEFRPQDHICLKSATLEQVVNGKLQVVAQFSADSMAYPPVLNYPATEPL